MIRSMLSQEDEYKIVLDLPTKEDFLKLKLEIERKIMTLTSKHKQSKQV